MIRTLSATAWECLWERERDSTDRALAGCGLTPFIAADRGGESSPLMCYLPVGHEGPCYLIAVSDALRAEHSMRTVRP